jgi:purine-binding chemotaxis protein CheW
MEAKSGQYLTFFLNRQAYGVPIGTVREINRMSEITVVPETPVFVSGVMNLRGKVIPVINLRLRLGLPEIPYTKETCIIIIEGQSGQVGMIVDSVNAVIELTENQIEPRPVMGDSSKLGYVMGMGKVENQVIVLLAIVECLSMAHISGINKELSQAG